MGADTRLGCVSSVASHPVMRVCLVGEYCKGKNSDLCFPINVRVWDPFFACHFYKAGELSSWCIIHFPGSAVSHLPLALYQSFEGEKLNL